MAGKPPLSEEEAAELFSQLNESGMVDEARSKSGDGVSVHAPRADVDPLSNADPSGSKTADAISRTAIFSILLVFVIVVGMQVAYGVARRLNTANLSTTADVETVTHAMESGVEWGNGFTQFPEEFTVDEASETTGIIEVSVVDTDSANELELLSNSQIQASALATNALLNDKVNKVIYNVYALVDEEGTIQHDTFFGLIKATGTKVAMLSFVWTKSTSDDSSSIDWELTIIGLDEITTEAIQEQVNSVSSIANDPSITQSELEDEAEEQALEQGLHGSELFYGGDEEASLDEEETDDEGDEDGSGEDGSDAAASDETSASE